MGDVSPVVVIGPELPSFESVHVHSLRLQRSWLYHDETNGERTHGRLQIRNSSFSAIRNSGTFEHGTIARVGGLALVFSGNHFTDISAASKGGAVVTAISRNNGSILAHDNTFEDITCGSGGCVYRVAL